MTPTATKWDLEPHTRAKHEILRGYLNAWLPIMAHSKPRPKRVTVLDGFAGPGVYKSGEEGSPLIALRALLGRHDLSRVPEDIDFRFIFFEENEERFDSLQTQIERLKATYEPWPANLSILPRQPMSFVDGCKWLIANDPPGGAHDPMFSFIDPFGVKGVPLDLIRELCQHRKTEAFVLYMYNTVQRFAGHEVIDNHFRDLFGTDEFATAVKSPARRSKLRQLYPERLKAECGFDYTLGFEMKNSSGQVYDLVYGTRSLKGLARMKEAMWKVDDTGEFRFATGRVGYLSLFSTEEHRQDKVRSLILERFANHGNITVEKIENFILVETAFRETHWRKPLKQLELEGRLIVTSSPSPRRRTGTFAPGTVVRFT